MEPNTPLNVTAIGDSNAARKRTIQQYRSRLVYDPACEDDDTLALRRLVSEWVHCPAMELRDAITKGTMGLGFTEVRLAAVPITAWGVPIMDFKTALRWRRTLIHLNSGAELGRPLAWATCPIEWLGQVFQGWIAPKSRVPLKGTWAHWRFPRWRGDGPQDEAVLRWAVRVPHLMTAVVPGPLKLTDSGEAEGVIRVFGWWTLVDDDRLGNGLIDDAVALGGNVDMRIGWQPLLRAILDARLNTMWWFDPRIALEARREELQRTLDAEDRAAAIAAEKAKEAT